MNSCQLRQTEIKKLLTSCATDAERYQMIIALGRKLPPFPKEHMTEENLVPGCQSLLYLYAWREGEKLRLAAHSDALISQGLAALLLFIYDGETPATILQSPPHCFTELKLLSLLSPGRSNGFLSLLHRIQKLAMVEALDHR
jgi:cysteine desulfuration protein SufE